MSRVLSSDMERPHQRSRSKSGLSFKSERSHRSQGSTGSKPKESPEEKRRSHFSPTGKANPNAAINEAQPIAAALEKPTIGSLRSFTHVDSHGNAIAEPDLSNPTRPRWERPLDTIKSFEAAIDTEYKRRSLIRADTAPEPSSNFQSRRSSYHGGHQTSQNSNGERSQKYSGYYGNGSTFGRDGYFGDQQQQVPSGTGPPRSRPAPRMWSDPHAARHNNGQQMYPNQLYQQSRDTLNTGGSGSGSDPYGNTTDPSSDNSSVERTTPVAQKYDLGEQYGFAGFGGAPIMEEYQHQDLNYSHPHTTRSSGFYPPGHLDSSLPAPVSALAPGPAPPSKQLSRKPTSPGVAMQPLPDVRQARPRTLTKTDAGEKRKSWFKRRFSKD